MVKSVLKTEEKPAKKSKGKTWYKCLRCGSHAKKNSGLKETWTCDLCGDKTSYDIKEMHD
jgi:DNA-directed RNA polymerase subunit RPC12/RpoP